jgi:hypothetical protein
MSQNGPPSSPGAGGPPGARKPDAKKAPLSKREYSLKLNFSMMLTTVIVLLIGVSWVFMLGVIVGRGHNPDDKIYELTGRVLHGGRQAAPVVQEPPQAILRPEELHFWPSLRDKSLHNSAVDLETPAARTPARQADAGAADAPAGNAASASTPQPPLQLVPQSGLSTRFDFVYQVAVFRDDAQADRLRERLEGEGLRTALEKSQARDGKSLYKVLASRRGTEEDNAQLLAVLERLKLGPPLLRSKKAVPGGGGAGGGGTR